MQNNYLKITEDLLIERGFKIKEMLGKLKDLYENEGWIVFSITSDDGFHINVTKNMSNYPGRDWCVHVDNQNFETIGSIDAQSADHFNSLMSGLGCSFRL